MHRYLLVLAACSSSPAAKPTASTAWPVPAGWKSETIPFPLGFAPDIKHEGVEELRFPPGFFQVDAPDYFSYAFTWRTKDAAELDETALGNELAMYFRGLMKTVDESKHQIEDVNAITATATRQGARFAVSAHILDAFGAANAVDIEGWAERRACGSGALWIFVLAPKTTTIRMQLEELAAKATCH